MPTISGPTPWVIVAFLSPSIPDHDDQQQDGSGHPSEQPHQESPIGGLARRRGGAWTRVTGSERADSLVGRDDTATSHTENDDEPQRQS